jgi:predicted nucleic acid-binding protein
MKVLFDTNVLLDVLLARKPFAEAAVQLMSLADKGKLQGVLCATSMMTIHYLAAKAVGRRQARKHVRELLAIFEVAVVDRGVLEQALEMRFQNFEDAVLHESARAAGAAAIVTCNLRDFARTSLPIFSPGELLSAMLADRP